MADSEPDSVYENRYRSHRATKAKEKKSLERKRYQGGALIKTRSQWQSLEKEPRQTGLGHRGRGHSPLTFWAFPDVSVFAPKSLKIMNVPH